MIEMREVFRFKIYDITIDDFRISRRLGTLRAIETIHGAQHIPESKVEIPASAFSKDHSGLTDRDYDPQNAD